MFRAFPRPLVVETFGIVIVLGGLWDGRVLLTKWESYKCSDACFWMR